MLAAMAHEKPRVTALAESEHTAVLIVGGGGAGLTASMLLADLGIDALLVSSLPETSDLPKAHVLNQRTMEVLEDLGAADAIASLSTPAANMAATAFYAGFAGGEGYGWRIARLECWGAGRADEHWALASPCRQMNLPQIRLEPVLKARADELSPGRVRFNHELIALEQDDDQVTALVVDKNAGREYTVRCRYLLAADGGRTVASQLGIEYEGLGALTNTATVHASGDFSAWAADPDVLIRWIISPQTGTGVVMVPMGPGRWGPHSEEWVIHLNYPMDDPRAHSDERVEADVRSALGLPDLPLQIHKITRWTVEAVLAATFNVGRVFLLGDAAHRHPPTGGLGLTSAVQDAHNLCWKLAAVLSGTASEALLETYEPERRSVDERNAHRSLENAINHLEIINALGVSHEHTESENWVRLRRLWSAREEDAQVRRTTLRLMRAQSMEFSELNVEYGYGYESAAVIPDGSPDPVRLDEVRVYEPSTRPGSPLPHAWIEDERGVRIPIKNLVAPGRFLLIAGEDGQPWRDAALRLAATSDVPLDAVCIGHLDGDLFDPRCMWLRVREIGPHGAILVRPDRFVAWRCMGPADDPIGQLAGALESLLSCAVAVPLAATPA
jgi:2,4-dichlorophenol 6-monooxygenase